MDIGIISIRYAKALLRFAIDNKEEERVYAEIETLAHSFLHIPTLRQVLQDPLSDNARQVEILTCATCGNGSLSASTDRFIQLVTAHNRTDLMQFIAQAFITLYLKRKRIIKGRLIVPTATPETICKKLQEIIEKRTNCSIEFKVEIDASIAGGFILDYDTYRLDASLKTQLKELRDALA